MPIFDKARMGRAALTGAAVFAFAFSASGAMAATDDVVVSSHEARSISVGLAGYDASSTSDQIGMNARIDRAARQVCDVNGGSKLDASPKARACLASARDGAEAQLRALGQNGQRMAMTAPATTRR